jgi:hypothetical protein
VELLRSAVINISLEPNNCHWDSTSSKSIRLFGNISSLNVVATGAGITYQWRKGTTILTNGGSISGDHSHFNHKSSS